MDALRVRIETNLAGFERVALDPTGRRRAAVAIVLNPTETGPAYLLTRRALHMRRGAGNYALPGGNVDADEDAIDAARRETEEEVGVRLPREAALGLLDDFLTLGGHVVTPVVFWTAHAGDAWSPTRQEVHDAWYVPLSRPRPSSHTPKRPKNPAGGPPLLAHVRPRRLGERADGGVAVAVPRGLPARPPVPHRRGGPAQLDGPVAPK